MRYYILDHTDHSGEPYIVAEIASEHPNSSYVSSEWGVGPRRRVCSRDEVLAIRGGRRALLRWGSGDDTIHDEEARRHIEEIEAEDERQEKMSDEEIEAEIRATLYGSGMNSEQVEEWIRATAPSRPLHSV